MHSLEVPFAHTRALFEKSARPQRENRTQGTPTGAPPTAAHRPPRLPYLSNWPVSGLASGLLPVPRLPRSNPVASCGTSTRLPLRGQRRTGHLVTRDAPASRLIPPANAVGTPEARRILGIRSVGVKPTHGEPQPNQLSFSARQQLQKKTHHSFHSRSHPWIHEAIFLS